MDGWKMILSFWGPAYFQGGTVSFREGILGRFWRGSMVVLISKFCLVDWKKRDYIMNKGTVGKKLLVCKVNILWNSSATLLYYCWIPFLILQARWHIFGRNIFRATLWQSNITMDDFRWKKIKCSNHPWSIAMLVLNSIALSLFPQCFKQSFFVIQITCRKRWNLSMCGPSPEGGQFV